MTEHEAVEQLVPWYGTQELSAPEAARVERHLADCAPCRDLLAHARSHRDVLARRGTDFLAHVDPVLLTEFAENPGALDRETRGFIEQQLRECETCREAYALLGEVASSLAPAGAFSRVWEWLGASLLRPAPALAYLLLVALLVPYALLRERGGDDAPLTVAPVLVVPGEQAVRDDTGAPAPAPLAIPLPHDREASIVLLLETSLVEADLRAGGLPLSVELRRGAELVWSRRIGPAELDFGRGRGVLPVVLRASTLHAGGDYEIAIRALLPGDPLDGQALFRRRLALEEHR